MNQHKQISDEEIYLTDDKNERCKLLGNKFLNLYKKCLKCGYRGKKYLYFILERDGKDIYCSSCSQCYLTIDMEKLEDYLIDPRPKPHWRNSLMVKWKDTPK